MSLENQFESLSLAPNLPWQQLDGQIVILNPKDNLAFELNEVGSRVWQAIDSKSDFQSLISELELEFDVEREQLEADIKHWAAQLVDEGLLTRES